MLTYIFLDIMFINATMYFLCFGTVSCGTESALRRKMDGEFMLVLWLPSKVVLGIRRSFVVIHKKKRKT